MFTRTHPLRRYSDVHQLLLASSLEPLIVQHDLSFPRWCSGTFYSPELLPTAAACESLGFGSKRFQKRRSIPSGRQKKSTYYSASAVPLSLLQKSACMRARVYVCLFACACVHAGLGAGSSGASGAARSVVRCAPPSCVSGKPRPEVRVSAGGECSPREPAGWFGVGRGSLRPLSPRLIYAEVS